MIEELERIINESDNIVFFGGAGVSTESGIPDFRSQDGLYNQKYDYPPELILSDRFFYYNYDEFYRFYFDKMIYPDIKPNYTHEFLSKLESMGKLKAIVTQNIDNLHEQAGSKNIYHIHGTINTNHCVNCNKEYSLDDILKMDKVICTCGGMIKPDVVLYGEMLPEEAFNKSIEAIGNADTLIVGGTSLTVYPAAGMINAFNGKNLIIINKDPVNVRCTLQINDKLGETFKKLNIGGKNE
ncbi:MAG: NAD-dependent protein deacylase [Bacilli bacterium]|nr:NAD-dependent protein deacylase [Bacilli bacterium]